MKSIEERRELLDKYLKKNKMVLDAGVQLIPSNTLTALVFRVLGKWLQVSISKQIFVRDADKLHTTDED